MAEFAHNNSFSNATGYTLFYLNYGLNPRMDDFQVSNNPHASNRLNNLFLAWEKAIIYLLKSQLTYKKNADCKLDGDVEYTVGDLV